MARQSTEACLGCMLAQAMLTRRKPARTPHARIPHARIPHARTPHARIPHAHVWAHVSAHVSARTTRRPRRQKVCVPTDEGDGLLCLHPCFLRKFKVRCPKRVCAPTRRVLCCNSTCALLQLHVCSTCALLCPCTLARTRMRRLPRALRQALSMPRTHPGRQDWPRFLASPCALGLEPCRCGQPEGHTRVTHQKMGGHHRMLRALRRLPLTTHVWRLPLTTHVWRLPLTTHVWRLPLTTNLWRAALGCRAQVLRHIAHLGGNPMLEVVSYHPCAILAPSLRCLPPSFLLPHAVSRSHSPSLSVSRSLLLPLRLPHCL